MLDSISCQNSTYEFNESSEKGLKDSLEYIFKILCEVIKNAIESGRKLFRTNDFMEIAQKMREHYYGFKFQIWDNDGQKKQFISILEDQVHPIYNRFLWLIVRNCAGKLFYSF